jgi:lipopolysaccharide export system protein LptA
MRSIHPAPRRVHALYGPFRAPPWLCAAMLLAAALAIGPALAQEKISGGILPGGNSKEPINIEAAKLDYFDKEQKLIYSGNVVATQGNSKLKAETLVIFLAPKEGTTTTGVPSSASEVSRMEASGHVTVSAKDQIGTGDRGIYEKSENKVYLIGNVTLTQGPNVTKGDKLIYDLNSSQAVVTGRVKSMFLPAGAEEPASRRPRKRTR